MSSYGFYFAVFLNITELEQISLRNLIQLGFVSGSSVKDVFDSSPCTADTYFRTKA